MMIDLHSHSTASDGTLSPGDLVDLASERGLKALCLTDHDTVDGLPEATERASQKGLRLLCGIEIEISWDNPGIFHLLGLNIGNYSHGMRELLPELQSLRASRNEGILANMRADGIKVELEDIARFAGGRIITRPHFADFLIDIGKVRDRKSAFETYLAPGKPYYSRYPGITLDRACTAIHASGGLAIVAHPLSLYLSWGRYPEQFRSWKDMGLDGIEARHPGADYKTALKFEAIAAELGLKTSAGSDFHGGKRPDRVLGKTLEERQTIDDSYLALFD